MKMRTKSYTSQNVYDAALERVRYIYRRFDHVVVSFSGGKDSTAVLHLATTVAREMNRLPVRVIFVDEEAIHPPTIEYVERVRLRPDVALEWYCLPVEHRNACSTVQPYWYCWNPLERDKWVRPMPPWAIRSHPKFTFGMSFQDWMPTIFPKSLGTVGMLTGIRAQESIRRLRMALNKKNDNFITSGPKSGNCFGCIPIYDWTSEDVWRVVQRFGLDYNRTYDVFNRTELHGRLLTQRVCPPFGEEPLRSLWIYAECWPEMWHKMLHRVHGVATAWRYSNTSLYGVRIEKPEELTWEEYTGLLIENEPNAKVRDHVRRTIRNLAANHANKTHDPIGESEPHPLTGCCWKFFAQIAARKDLKGRTSGSAAAHGERKRQKMGMTYEEAVQIYGKS